MYYRQSMDRLLATAILFFCACESPSPIPTPTSSDPSEAVVTGQVVIRIDTAQAQMTATAVSARLLQDAIVFPEGARLAIETPVRAVANCGTLIVSDGGAVCDNGVTATLKSALSEDL